MTHDLSLRSFDIPQLHKFAVGFDSIFDDLARITAKQNNSTNYPPHNLIKYGDDKFGLELAVAGFKDGDITIEVEKNQLTIKGEHPVNLDSTAEYLHHGISARSFLRSWTLADYVEVTGARVEDGMLTVTLERRVPEEEKPRRIAISYNK